MRARRGVLKALVEPKTKANVERQVTTVTLRPEIQLAWHQDGVTIEGLADGQLSLALHLTSHCEGTSRAIDSGLQILWRQHQEAST